MSTVLVAEDSGTVRELLRTALTLAGYQVLEAADGNAAWTMLHAHPVDAVVTDLHLPGLDGLSLVRNIRRDDRLKTLPAIIVTGNAAAGPAAAEAGADRVVLKPFTISAIGDAVSGAIETRTHMEAPA
jgi:CheY-like chemotaxis protein